MRHVLSESVFGDKSLQSIDIECCISATARALRVQRMARSATEAAKLCSLEQTKIQKEILAFRTLYDDVSFLGVCIASIKKMLLR
jgi:hypothetical protein